MLISEARVIFLTVAIALAGVFGQDLSEIPADLTFSCVGKSYGYYADVSTNCKVFHICLGDGDVKWSFLCPNQTSFHQQYFVCDYDVNVDCKSSEIYYNLNDNFGQVISREGEQQQQRLARQKPFIDVEERHEEDVEPSDDFPDAYSVAEEKILADAYNVAEASNVNEVLDTNDASDLSNVNDVEETTLRIRNDEIVKVES